MNLQYISRKDKDDDERPYEVHFLVDLDSDRAYGYVESPSERSNQIMFVALPYEGSKRWYLTLDTAKAYLTQVAIEQDSKENSEFTTAMLAATQEEAKEKATAE